MSIRNCVISVTSKPLNHQAEDDYIAGPYGMVQNGIKNETFMTPKLRLEQHFKINKFQFFTQQNQILFVHKKHSLLII